MEKRVKKKREASDISGENPFVFGKIKKGSDLDSTLKIKEKEVKM